MAGALGRDHRRLGGAADEARWICQAASGCEGAEWLDGLDDAATTGGVAGSTPWSPAGARASRSSTCSASWGFRRPRPLGRPPGADPPARDRAGRGGRPRRWRRRAAAPASSSPTSARARARSRCRWPPSCRSRAWRCGRPTSRPTPSTWPGPTSPASAGPGQRAPGPRATGSTPCPPSSRGRLDLVVGQPALRRRPRTTLGEEVRAWEPLGRAARRAGRPRRPARGSSPAHRAMARAGGAAGARDRGRAGRGGRRAGRGRRPRRRRGAPDLGRPRPHRRGAATALTRDAQRLARLDRARRGQRRASASRRNSSCRSSRFSATTSWGVMWVTPESGSTWCGRPAASSADDSCERVGGHDVVVGQAVDQQQRPLQPVGVEQQRRAVVGLAGRGRGRRGSARCSGCRTAATR